MLGTPRELFRSRCCVRLPGGSWSDGFYLGSLASGCVVGVTPPVAAPSPEPDGQPPAAARPEVSPGPPLQYELGVSSGMAGGAFWRTKLITLSYRYMLANRSGRDLLLRQV